MHKRRAGRAQEAVGLTPALVNARVWQRDNVARYANRVLRPVEVILLARHRDELSGRVLELGCGAGRILGYLAAIGNEVHGIDVSARMVEYCRRRYPDAHVHLADLRAMTDTVDGPFDAVLALDNVLDVVEPDQRRRALEDIRTLLRPGGALIFSSHNLAHVDRAHGTAPADEGPLNASRRVARRAARVSSPRRRPASCAWCGGRATGGGSRHSSAGLPITRSSTTTRPTTGFCITTFAATTRTASSARRALCFSSVSRPKVRRSPVGPTATVRGCTTSLVGCSAPD